MTTPVEPDWTRWCKATDLDELGGCPYMLRTSDDPGSPWRWVDDRRDGWWTEKLPPDTPGEPEKTLRVDYMTVTFYRDVSQRVLNDTDDVEVGLVTPPIGQQYPERFRERPPGG
jgi:hypothetical protein